MFITDFPFDLTEQGSIGNLSYGEWEKSVLILYMNSCIENLARLHSDALGWQYS